MGRELFDTWRPTVHDTEGSTSRESHEPGGVDIYPVAYMLCP
jgi:hypothetical protein